MVFKNLVWFRNDLRVADNTALWNAMQDGPTMACFQLTPEQWQAHDMAHIKIALILDSVQVLLERLAEFGVPLVVLDDQRFSQAPDSLLGLAQQHGCQHLYFNREYLVNECARDEQVVRKFQVAERCVSQFDDSLVVPPGRVVKGDGEYYKVYTPFKRNWLQQVGERAPDVLPVPDVQVGPKALASSRALALDVLRRARERLDLGGKTDWPAGEMVASNRMQHFLQGIAGYKDARDFPAIDGTSQLSHHLSVGAISARQCLEAAMLENQNELTSGSEGVQCWISELIWREFYCHLIVANPKLCKHQPFKPETERLQWRDSDADFERWCQGETGVPMVDAGMRQLNQTGWMHNRVRMIVAMFLTKNLWLDWRRGERYFMQHLVDGDLSQNNAGWQWSASTGTDAAPYFRIFNPFSQALRFDPQGGYIKHWVPELGEVSPKVLHSLDALSRANIAGYPKIMVDLKVSRQQAIDAFSAL